MNQPKHILVFRFSAMGDVAMTIPVMKQLLQQYPDLQITFVSNKSFEPLFHTIDRLKFHAADLKKEHRGVKGLYKLYNQLKKAYDFDAIADLHKVLRTKAMRTFFSFSSVPVAVIDKGRKEKKMLTRKMNKILAPLPSSYQRYAAVFAKLGLPVNVDEQFIPLQLKSADNPLMLYRNQRMKLIGIAPFAKHETKTYPHEKMKETIRELTRIKDTRILLFGGGEKEIKLLHEWAKEIGEVEVLAGKMKLDEELEYISNLDVMVSMDSANMHLASLVGIPVVSIWGATHPFMGFYGWGQSPNHAVQAELFCRPCSVFGNKPCYRHNLECMHLITPQMIIDRIRKVLFL